jgi:hypothetical protein
MTTHKFRFDPERGVIVSVYQSEEPVTASSRVLWGLLALAVLVAIAVAIAVLR